MPIIFLAVAALVLNVLMMRLIDQQRSIIGTLKALGYSNGQIFLAFHEVRRAGRPVRRPGRASDGLRNGEIYHLALSRFFEFPQLEKLSIPICTAYAR